MGPMPIFVRSDTAWSSTTSGKRTDQKKLAFLGGGQDRNHGGEAGVLALGEGRLDAGAGVVQHPHMGRVDLRQTLRRAGEVELDDLGRAGADEEQLLDVGDGG
jgi:hypothetical protein